MTLKPDQIIEYKVAVLLAEHGERTVVRTLARKLGLSIQELERKLDELNQAKPRTPSPRKHVDSSRAIESIIADNPQKADSLRILFRGFENRTFLPD